MKIQQESLNNATMSGRQKIIEIGKTFRPDFELSNYNVGNYEKLYYYFTKNKEKCEELGISLNKGLWIYGDVGAGKSLAMKVFQEFCFYTQHINNKFRIYPYSKVEADYGKNKNEFIEAYGSLANYDICFDEFLTRSIINDYGVKRNLIEMILHERYESFTNKGHITHIITNIIPDYIAENELLDLRILDRCSEMFNTILWKGKSLR